MSLLFLHTWRRFKRIVPAMFHIWAVLKWSPSLPRVLVIAQVWSDINLPHNFSKRAEQKGNRDTREGIECMSTDRIIRELSRFIPPACCALLLHNIAIGYLIRRKTALSIKHTKWLLLDFYLLFDTHEWAHTFNWMLVWLSFFASTSRSEQQQIKRERREIEMRVEFWKRNSPKSSLAINWCDFNQVRFSFSLLALLCKWVSGLIVDWISGEWSHLKAFLPSVELRFVARRKQRRATKSFRKFSSRVSSAFEASGHLETVPMTIYQAI